MKSRWWVVVLKLGLAAALLAYLLHQVRQNDGFERFINGEKNWAVVGIGVLCILASVTLSFVRWHWLIRALGLSVRLVDSLRLGALGFALNFVALGNVGGDVFKAIFLARDQPGRRTEAVATVAVDRVLGLFTMLVLASYVVATTNLDYQVSTPVAILCRAALGATAIGFAGILAALFMPGITSNWWQDKIRAIPLVGPVAANLLGALHVYRTRKTQLAAAFGLSFVVDALFVLSFFFIARGLPIDAPALVEHFFIVPLALIAGAIPITPSGLGTLEAAVDALYQAVPSGTNIAAGDGTLVALAQRVGMVLVAGVGMAFYACTKRESESMPESASLALTDP